MLAWNVGASPVLDSDGGHPKESAKKIGNENVYLVFTPELM